MLSGHTLLLVLRFHIKIHAIKKCPVFHGHIPVREKLRTGTPSDRCTHTIQVYVVVCLHPFNLAHLPN